MTCMQCSLADTPIRAHTFVCVVSCSLHLLALSGGLDFAATAPEFHFGSLRCRCQHQLSARTEHALTATSLFLRLCLSLSVLIAGTPTRRQRLSQTTRSDTLCLALKTTPARPQVKMALLLAFPCRSQCFCTCRTRACTWATRRQRCTQNTHSIRHQQSGLRSTGVSLTVT